MLRVNQILKQDLFRKKHYLIFSGTVRLKTPVWGKAFHLVYRACLSWASFKFYVCPSFPFGIEGRMWDVIVLIPGHCLSIYLLFILNFVYLFIKKLYEYKKIRQWSIFKPAPFVTMFCLMAK